MSKKETKDSNPQMAVIQAVLDDISTTRDLIKIALGGWEPPKTKQGKNPTEEETLTAKLTHLRVRHEAAVQVLTRDNYYRIMNPELIKVWSEIPQLVENAALEGDLTQALEIALIWEAILHRIFRECYPNYRELFFQLLEAASKMRIIAMPKGTFGADLFGDASTGFKFENV